MYWNDGGQHGSELRGHAFGNKQAGCGEVESTLLVMPFLYGGEKFVAESEIESKFRRNLPIILREEGIHLMVIINVVQVIDTAAVSQSDQERGETRAASEHGGRIRVVSETGTEVEGAARCCFPWTQLTFSETPYVF
jgi:hypothetical protein